MKAQYVTGLASVELSVHRIAATCLLNHGCASLEGRSATFTMSMAEATAPSLLQKPFEDDKNFARIRHKHRRSLARQTTGLKAILTD
jgi:hypothetical protein